MAGPITKRMKGDNIEMQLALWETVLDGEALVSPPKPTKQRN